MKRAVAMLLVLLAALVCLSAASRQPGSIATDIERLLEEDVASGFQDITQLQSMLWGRGRSHRQHGHGMQPFDEGAYVVFKYYVPPSKADDFIDNWRKMGEKTMDEKHNIVTKLHKTSDDKAFKDHLSQRYVEDFFNYLLDEDIPLRWQPLFKLTEDVYKYKDEANDANRGRRYHEKQTHVIFRYVVPPSESEDFIATWKDAADKVDRYEKGAMEYTLRKVATNNLEWYTCGTWESMDDFMDHFSSKHIEKLHQWTAKNDVVWKMSCMRNVGCSSEKY